VSECFTKNIKH